MTATIIKIITVAISNAETEKRGEMKVADLLLTEPRLNFSERVSVPLDILGNHQVGARFRVHFEQIAAADPP